MIVLGSTSDVAQAFVEEALKQGERFEKIYLLTSNKETAERFARHIDVKFLQQAEVIELDLMKEIDYIRFEKINSSLLFCAAGYLGEGTEEGLYDNNTTERMIEINYSKLS